jgi:GT2 family glycosyltransferase
MLPDVSIIIVNWNGRQLLQECLDALRRVVTDLTFEIFVVDNASTDGSQGMIKQDFPEVKLIANSNNLGFAKANNQAIRVSQGRYVLLLNSDAFVHENTIDQIVAFMETHPEAGMAGCKLLNTDGTLQPSCTTFPTLFTELCIATGLDRLFPRNPLFGKYQMTYWDFNDIREVDSIRGAFMLVRASAIKEVGLLDESYFMYSEEVDWCYQFKKKGWKIYYYPFVETIHVWGGSVGQVQMKMLIQLYRSQIDFFRKNYGKLSAFFLKLIIGTNCLIRVGPGALYYLLSHDRENRQKHQAFWQLLRILPAL